MYRCIVLGQIVHKNIASYPSSASKQFGLPEDISNQSFTNENTVHRETIGMSKANDCSTRCHTIFVMLRTRATPHGGVAYVRSVVGWVHLHFLPWLIVSRSAV